jgi:NCS1 family nucleobase:cation symporter-1
LIGYSALLGPVIGIILVDYFLVRRTHLNTTDLYRKNGRYSGVNPKAVIALVLGVAPNIPGFLAQIGLSNASGGLVDLYHYAWFTGLFVAGIVYWAIMPKNLDETTA